MRRDFEAYIDEISEMHDEYVRQLTACSRNLPRTFENGEILNECLIL